MSAPYPASAFRRRRGGDTIAIAQRASVAKRRAGEIDHRSGRALVASLGENEGWPTPSSSPLVCWLVAQLGKAS